jgi:hypothetical protein
VNEQKDWWYAEHLIESGAARLPAVAAAVWSAAGAM